MSKGKLIVTRHAESEWNAVGKWTGTTDVHLTVKGRREAILLGHEIKDTPIDRAYCSRQIRSLETLEAMLNSSGQYDVPYERNRAIDERDYGDYTGKNKWEVKEKVGEEEFNNIRRGWDYHVPNGETLKMVYERSVPFYQQVILPQVLDGKNILIVAHGNSIRSLMKYIEKISDQKISDVEMIFGVVVFYDVDDDGYMIEKVERKIDTTPPKA